MIKPETDPNSVLSSSIFEVEIFILAQNVFRNSTKGLETLTGMFALFSSKGRSLGIENIDSRTDISHRTFE